MAMKNRMMNRSKFLVLMVAFLIGGTAILAAQTTGSITLTGVVSQILEITVTPEAGYDSLDLTTSQTDLLVATVNERSNSQAGYRVEVESTNAAAAASSTPFFVGADPGNTDTLTYSVSYGGAAATFNTSGVAEVTNVGSTTGTAGVNKAVEITYTGSFLNADTYSDTLTFTIIAN